MAPPPTLLAVHCRVADNVGDWHASPVDYFPFPLEVRRMHLRQLRPWHFGQPMLVGGGGLLFFAKRLRRMLARKRAPMVAWGIGHNAHGESRVDYSGHDYLAGFDAVGVRDVGAPWPLVPCVSCMSPLFDDDYPEEHELVVYAHERFPVGGDTAGLPTLGNAADWPRVIRFLASARTVVTSSYHGAYWATLLGKRVVAVPFSSKFHAMPHPPTLAAPGQWAQALTQARSHAGALAACRAANRDYYRKAYAALLGG